LLWSQATAAFSVSNCLSRFAIASRSISALDWASDVVGAAQLADDGGQLGGSAAEQGGSRSDRLVPASLDVADQGDEVGLALAPESGKTNAWVAAGIFAAICFARKMLEPV